MSGHYDDTGAHRCDCGEPTVYQLFSGGREFYCKACGNQGRYPEGPGGPRARLLTEPDGHLKLRTQMYEEIGRRKASNQERDPASEPGRFRDWHWTASNQEGERP